MNKGGSAPSIPDKYTITLAGGIDADLDNIHVKEIAPVTVNSNVAVTQPIVTQSTSKSDSTLKVDPLSVSSDSTSAIDIKPLAVDSCQTLKLAPLPPVKVEQPYAHHFGFTFLGMELWGFNVSGKSETFLHSPATPKHHRVEVPGSRDCCGGSRETESDPAQPRSGLRVRVK